MWRWDIRIICGIVTFHKTVKNNFLICEMEQYIGGNSYRDGTNSQNTHSRSTHYLPLPNKEDVEVISFLKEAEMYLGDNESGKPILDDYQLFVFPQNERLFLRILGKMILFLKNMFLKKSRKSFYAFFRITKDFKERKILQVNIGL